MVIGSEVIRVSYNSMKCNFVIDMDGDFLELLGFFFLLIGWLFIFMKVMSKIRLNIFVWLLKIRKRKIILYELLYVFIWIVRKYFFFFYKWGYYIILIEMNFCLVNVYLKYKIFRNKYIVDIGRMVYLCVWYFYLYEFLKILYFKYILIK